MIYQAQVDQAVFLLVEAERPGRIMILGSHAYGTFHFAYSKLIQTLQLAFLLETHPQFVIVFHAGYRS